MKYSIIYLFYWITWLLLIEISKCWVWALGCVSLPGGETGQQIYNAHTRTQYSKGQQGTCDTELRSNLKSIIITNNNNNNRYRSVEVTAYFISNVLRRAAIISRSVLSLPVTNWHSKCRTSYLDFSLYACNRLWLQNIQNNLNSLNDSSNYKFYIPGVSIFFLRCSNANISGQAFGDFSKIIFSIRALLFLSSFVVINTSSVAI